MAAAAAALRQEHPDIGAIVLECTNMPPYADAVRRACIGVPVFDVVTLLSHAWQAIISPRYFSCGVQAE
jgi:hypothetical protein